MSIYEFVRRLAELSPGCLQNVLQNIDENDAMTIKQAVKFYKILCEAGLVYFFECQVREILKDAS